MGRHLDTDVVKYYYPPLDPKPGGGEKVALLTIGNQQVIGQWDDNGGYKGWAKLTGRDKDKERQLGYLPPLPE